MNELSLEYLKDKMPELEWKTLEAEPGTNSIRVGHFCYTPKNHTCVAMVCQQDDRILIWLFYNHRIFNKKLVKSLWQIEPIINEHLERIIRIQK